MRLRRLDPATALASLACAVGVVSIVSALTPSIASRSDLVGGVLPGGVPAAARTLTISFGLVLVWLWGGLRRRKRRAWQLAVVVVVAAAASHLAKGLDFEEAALSLLVLGALWRWRGEFTAPGDPDALHPLLRNGAALAAVAVATRALTVHDRIGDSLTVVAAALVARILYLWLRPIAARAAQTHADRAAAEALVRAHGSDTLAHFSLRRDKAWFFSPTGRSFLAYGTKGGTAIVAGDPIGDAADLPLLLDAFRSFAREHGWGIAALGVSDAAASALREHGFRTLYIGDEAVVRPDAFSLEGRAVRKVRQSVARVARVGVTARVIRAGDADEATRARVARVSREWLGSQPERGWTMAMDAVFDYPDSVLALAESSDGAVLGFVHWVPSPASGAWSLSAMRRVTDAPNGVMEFLLVESIAWAQGVGASELSLNFALFGDVLRSGREGAAWKRVFRAALLGLDRLFQLERLNAFNRKFRPEWRPRYLCFESWAQLPAAGLACLRAESLLVPPGPWVKKEVAA